MIRSVLMEIIAGLANSASYQRAEALLKELQAFPYSLVFSAFSPSHRTQIYTGFLQPVLLKDKYCLLFVGI